MNIDVAIPSGNEKQMIAFSKKLGFGGIIFLYEKGKKQYAPNDTEKAENFKVICSNLSEKHEQKAKGMLFSRGNENARWIFEKLKPHAVFDLEKGKEKDRMSYRTSNLDQVQCRLAKKNGTLIGFNVSAMVTGDKKLLGRALQNVRLCEKYDLDCFFASFAEKPEQMRSCHDMKALALAMGMSTEFMKKTFSVLENLILK